MNSILGSCETAIRLNNDAVCQAWLGHDDSAILLLSRSLRIIKSIMIADKGSTGISDDNDLASTFPPACSLHFNKVKLPPPQEDELAVNTNGERNFLFDKVIYLSPAHLQVKYQDNIVADQRSRLCSAVIVLNLSILHHRQALSSSRQNNTILLSKTEKLYELAIQLAPDDYLWAREVNPGHLVKLAAINNLSNIQFGRGGCSFVQAAHFGFQRLEGILVSLQADILSGLLDAQEYNGMLQNALALMPRRMTATAA